MAKRILISLFIIVFVGLASVFLAVNKTEKASASDIQVLSGFGWFGADCTDPAQATCGTKTNPIGWVSFGDKNINKQITCGSIPYGVNADFGTGDISGYAWIGVGENVNVSECDTNEKSVGWLSFETTSGLPSTGKYDYEAKLIDVSGKKEIAGWAPIISSGGTLTWVRFKEDRTDRKNYSNVINTDGTVGTRDSSDITKCAAGSTDHYAWAGNPSEGGLGWLDLCLVSTDSFINIPPVITVSASPMPSCDLTSPATVLSINLTNEQPGDTPLLRQITISRVNYNYNATSVQQTASGEFNTSTLNLNWNTSYNYTVQVWDHYGAASNIVSGSFTTSVKPPSSDFSSFGQLKINTDITFNAVESGVAYDWTFKDGVPSTSTSRNPKVRFSANGSKTVKLTVAKSGMSCLTSKEITIGASNPFWREIIPFWK